MTEIAKLSGPQAIERLDRAAARMEPRIARAFNDALENLRDRLSANEVAALLEQGDVEGVVNLMRPNVTEDALQTVSAAISASVMEGGKLAAEIQPSILGATGDRLQFVFDVANPKLQQYAETLTSTRIREVGNDVRAVTRQVIAQNTTAGINPRETARRLRDSIGLTVRQEQAVNNYRRALENLDTAALERELRDRRFDSTVRRAISNNQPLDQERIDRMVERYRARAVKHRSEVIARTESIRSIQGAQHEYVQHQIDTGRVKKEQIRRFWHTAMDERVRSSHRMIPAMNEDGVGQNEPFQTPDGPLMFPGDPSGPPRATISCRCTVFSRIVSLELIEDAA